MNPTQTAEPMVLEKVRRLVEDVLTATPHFLVDLEVRGARGSRAVEVYVDSDAGLSVEALAQISRDLAFLIDAEEILADGYRLTVSSPGLDRPLKLPRQYRKNLGRMLRVHYRKQDGEGYTETTGELLAAEDDAIDVAVSKQKKLRIRFDDILWAKVQLPW